MGPENFISGKFLGDADAAGPRTTCSEPLLNLNSSISDEETGVQSRKGSCPRSYSGSEAGQGLGTRPLDLIPRGSPCQGPGSECLGKVY